MKITALVNTPSSGVSMYRSAGVLPLIGKNVQVKWREKSIDWRDCVDTDIFFFQRPCNQIELDGLSLARRTGIPTWIDCDDLDLDIPTYNPRHKMFEMPGVKDRIRRALGMADVVTVSTPELRRQYLEYNENVLVVPNALNARWMPLEPAGERANTVVWRGGPSHDGDMLEHGGAISKLTHEFPETQFVFMGDPFWAVLDVCNPDNTKTIPAQEMTMYFQTLKVMRPKVVMVPLKENAFNKCKSNISWIEATWAGAVTVGPAWSEEFRQPGVIAYGPDYSFFDAVAGAILHNDPAADLNAMSQEQVERAWTLDLINEFRGLIAKKLIAREKLTF